MHEKARLLLRHVGHPGTRGAFRQSAGIDRRPLMPGEQGVASRNERILRERLFAELYYRDAAAQGGGSDRAYPTNGVAGRSLLQSGLSLHIGGEVGCSCAMQVSKWAFAL